VAILRFDDLVGRGDRKIPPGSTIIRAKLRVVTGPGTAARGHGARVYRLRKPIAFDNAFSTLLKEAEGDQSDILAGPTAWLGSPTLQRVIEAGPIELDVTADVQAWASGMENHGWAFVPWPNGMDAWAFPKPDCPQVADRPSLSITFIPPAIGDPGPGRAPVTVEPPPSRPPAPGLARESRPFDGRTRVTVSGPEAFDMTGRSYTISARIKTRRGGTIFSKTPEGPWVPGGKALFIRGGRLTFDIGWVGFVASQRRIDDDRWHEVAMTYHRENHRVHLFIDGKLDDPPNDPKPLVPRGAQGERNPVVRIGYASMNFPRPPNPTYFDGQISEVRFYQRALDGQQIAALPTKDPDGAPAVARWKLDPLLVAAIRDETGNGHEGTLEVGAARDDGVPTASIPKISRMTWDKQLIVNSGPNDIRSWGRLPGLVVRPENGILYAQAAFGRDALICTHPFGRQKPATIDFSTITSENAGRIDLMVKSYPSPRDPGGRIVVRVGNAVTSTVDIPVNAPWRTIPFAFDHAKVAVEHHPLGWDCEGMFFDYRIEIKPRSE
jgi:hypothetical protein